MPTLSSRGDITHGVGGGYASLNNAAFSRGAAGGFIDDDTIGFIDGTDDLWMASRYHIPTGTISRLADVPANHMFAGGGHAAWWFGAQSDARGVHATTGFRAVDGGLLGMGPDAAIVYKPSYQSNGPTMVRELDGSEWKLTDGHADYLSIQGERRILWMERMQVYTCNMPQPRFAPDGGIWKAEAMFAAGGWWITYYSGAHGIVLHPFDSFVGFAHLPKGDGWHSARAIDHRTIRIATAVSVAEQAGHIWVRDYDVLENRVKDPWGSNVWESIQRLDIRTINQPDSRIPFFEKNFSCGTFFCYSDRYGDEPDVPEHCTVVVEPGAVARAAARVPIIIAGDDAVLDAAVAVKDRVVALYIGDTAGWQDAEARARELKARWKGKSGRDTPVLWYITPSEPDQPGFRIPPSVDILGPEFYFSDWNNLGEQRATKLAMWIARLGAARPWVPICQAYDRGVWTADAMDGLAALMPSFVSQFFAADAPSAQRLQLLGVLFFAAGRPGGMRTYPALKTAYQRIFGAIRGPGAWPQPASRGDTVIPEVTIATYEPKDGDAPLRVRAVVKLTDPDHRIRALEWLYRPIGTQTWITAASNPPDDPDHTYTFAGAGTYEIKLRGVYDGGFAETGRQRLVTARSARPRAPEQPRGIKSSLRTASGRYLNAGPDGVCVVGDRPQEFDFVEISDRKMAFRGPNGKFAAAEGGGGREIRFRSDSVAGEWELFKVAPCDTGISLQAHASGLFVCAENAGNGPVLVNRERAGPWETFTPVPPLWPGGTD